jgi:predicted Zn finger-like uncharacterized protein
MFTVCPKCALTLVVTAADLRVAQGYVRCGRCSNVFNALNALSDERQTDPHPAPHETASRPRLEPAPPPSTPPPQPEPPAPPEPAEQVAEFEEEFTAETALPPISASEEEQEEEEAELEFDPTSTSVEEVFVEAPGEDSAATGTFESIVLESGVTEEEIEASVAEEPPEPPPPDPDSELDQELLSLAKKIETQNRLPAPDFSSASQSIRASAAETLQELGVTPGDDDAEDDEEETNRAPAWVWRAGIATLVVLLIVQAIHHYRSDLAVIPQLSGPLTSIYGALGVSLEPRWNVGAYEVRQLGAASDPAAPEKLVVRASIKNGAPLAQPLPLLRVAVQDRFGNRIASSDVAPAAYAPNASASRERLASGQRMDVEMRFVDPGTEAVGFEIDACLAAPGGGVNCANH